MGAGAVPAVGLPLAAVDLTPARLALLAAAGFAAGAVNAVAGGGSLISFPALLAAGYGSVPANVTNAVAVLPGYLGGTVGYRDELAGQRPRAVALSVTSAIGAVAGAVLLIESPAHVFREIVPFLILASCALLAAQPAITRRLGPSRRPGEEHMSVRLHAMQLAAAVYGGYFGAGLGILLLAVLGLGVRDSLHRLNALKGLLSLVIGLAAVAWFAAFGPVAWGAAAVMAAASLAGGRAGVSLARRLSASVLRWVIIALGAAVATWLLIQP